MISLNNKIKQSKLTFTVNSQEKPLVVNNYPGSWAQIFTNLIQNTMIHAYEPQSAGQVQLNFSKHGDTLHFEFIDDGKGMTEETQKKVFEPFYTTNRANGGSGLGMNILFNIVTQKMYGTISLHSAQGLGSKFIIEVPIDISSYVKGG
nr:HAMP domain-containing sensor histidine kinase [Marinifaba aquimaris]